jgi:hypothetical protein
VLDAAALVDLKVLSLINDYTAVALKCRRASRSGARMHATARTADGRMQRTARAVHRWNSHAARRDSHAASAASG